MCGFVIGNIFKDEDQFKTALNLINHRGRDNQLWVVNSNTYMGHNRLSIQGLNTESNQPMFMEYCSFICKSLITWSRCISN